MLSRTLLLVLAVLLLLSLVQGGIQRKQKHEVTKGPTEIKKCTKKPKWYLCKHHCESHQDCQANNICCSAPCGNVCLNLLDKDAWEMPVTPPSDTDYIDTGSPPSFEGDMILSLSPTTLSSFITPADK